MSKDLARQKLESAERHLQKGHRKRAVAELKRLLKKDPENIRGWTRLGDVYAELGEMALARDAYARVGEYYRREGYLLKAISMFKALAERFPDDPEILVVLGDLFRQMGLFSDAVIRYRHAIDLYHSERRVLEKLRVVERVLDLNPDAVVDRIRLAESYVRLDQVEGAKEQLRVAASELYRRGESEAFLQVAERFLHFQSDDVEMNRRLAEIYAQRKDYLKALERLQVCYELRPQGRDVLEMLARTFSELGERDKAGFVLGELVRLAEADNLLPEMERYKQQIARLSGGRAASGLRDRGVLKQGQEVEFEDFDEVTRAEEPSIDPDAEFSELPIDEEPETQISDEAPAELPFIEEEPEDDEEFDVGEFEETVVASTDVEAFEGGEDPFDKIRRMGADARAVVAEAVAAKDTAAAFAALAHDGPALAVAAEEAGADVPPPLPIPAPPPRIEDELPKSVREDLQEADFYLQHGMRDEAHAILSELIEQHPDSSAIAERLRLAGSEP